MALRVSVSLLGFVAAVIVAAGTTVQVPTLPALAASPGEGPAQQGDSLPQDVTGDAELGRDVFRTETFGNEGFWTDAVKLPAGVKAAKVTLLQALQLGLQIDSEKLGKDAADSLAADLLKDPTGRSSAFLNDPAMTGQIIAAGAVIGMPPKNGKVGTSCALCHTMTDASVLRVPEGGSIGKRLDGLANHSLNLGKIFAAAANTRALYTVAQTALTANKGKTLGRATSGLTEASTEAEFDAYFGNPEFYPIGMFDDTFDGNGNTMHNTPLFRQDLAAPYGSEGTITKVEDFSNLVFTTLFDQTMLTTPGGRAFVHTLAGGAGDEMIDDYVKILGETGVTGYPFVSSQARETGKPGELATPIGFRVDDKKLLALTAYLAKLPAPKGAEGDQSSITRGKKVFATSGCTSCHNIDQAQAVPTTLHNMANIFPGDQPKVLAERKPPLTPVLDTPGAIFDDKWVVVNASLRGEKRGVAMPLLLDLARKPVFLHDDSVKSLEELFMSSRGKTAPHPFFIADGERRGDVIAFLRSLDTGTQ